MFSRAPAFTSVVILTLALAVGATTAIFSIVHAVLLRKLPYKDADQLVAVWQRPKVSGSDTKMMDVYPHLELYQSRSHTLSEVAGESWFSNMSVMTGRGAARQVWVSPVTVNFFPMVGVPAALGRTFTPEDFNRGCSVVLTSSFWSRNLGRDPNIVGESIDLDNRSCDVIGVMPQNFIFYPEQTCLWSLITPTGSELKRASSFGLGIFARLRPGATVAQAQAELTQLQAQTEIQDGNHSQATVPVVMPLKDEYVALTGSNLRMSLLVLFAAVAAVLLIACLNVASLLLGRALVRQRELAIRAALGGSRTRLIRQLLTENLLLGSFASLLGIAVATVAVRYFNHVDPIAMPPGAVVQINWQVLAFAALLALLTTLVFGFLPAWRASQTKINDVLKASGRSTVSSPAAGRNGKLLVIAEVGLSLVLLIGAGLLIQSVIRFTSTPLGVSLDRLVTMSLSVSPVTYKDMDVRTRFYDRVLERVKQIPGVSDAAFTNVLPTEESGPNVLLVEGRPESPVQPIDTEYRVVSSDYFQLLHLEMLRGRGFGPMDRPKTDAVAIVNEELVRKYFPDSQALGRHIRLRGEDSWKTIVGIVRDEKQSFAAREMSWVSAPVMYRTMSQAARAEMHLLVRTALEPAVLGNQVQVQVATIAPDVPVFHMETMERVLSRETAYPRFRAVLLGSFAGIALLLAVIGLYSVLAQLVTQRTQEIGLRVALGAQQGDVLTMVMRQALQLTSIGLGVGIVASLGLTKYLASLLFGIQRTDIATFAGVSLILVAAALVAAYIPARRASRIDPAIALRSE
jgi:putative ABC transport system permease protein